MTGPHSLAARTIRHSYTGELITCAECDGQQHPCSEAFWRSEVCDSCGMDELEACMQCRVLISCCRVCRDRHAFECPWPL